MKSIRNYIVRTDINKANDQKKPNIMTPCYSCRKTCRLISSDETLKNIHNGKEIKKLDGGNCRRANIVYAARCKIHGDIYIGNTGEELRERFSKHRYDAKNRPDNNELTAHIHKLQYEYDKDIGVLLLKGNLYQKHERSYEKTNSSIYWIQKRLRDSIKNLDTTDVTFMKPSPTSLRKIRNFYLISR